ncbi:hypothetical protein E6Q11_03940 [Candidatus Dojkabacteria bacterium]|uniref:Ig-like domain-containing protein n=1 Tax=Candidatus Dojkabacteria bacterium TaxID=2099670 RepID=A0A5C7J6M7_9BACT|nr:MAG: hypothetical protein E6Q11_03940 [Candidatus Dojkabacteria bacterium]
MATTNLKPFFIPNSNADWPNAEIDTSPFSPPSGSATPVPSLVKGANLLNLIFNPDTVGNYGSVNVRVAKLSGGFSSWNNVPLVGEDCTSACPAPVFSSHPSNQTLVVGSTLTLSVSVSPMTSGQWFKDGSAIAFATSTTYTKANFQVSDAGSYYFVATNNCGSSTPVSATSNVATVQQGSSSLYYNTTQSQTFTRNNCPVGETGSTVTYTVAANTYSSAISQADADNQALADIAANGQAYANANGTCSGSGCVAITSVSLSYQNITNPSNTGNPSDGDHVRFTVSVNAGATSPTFQWIKDGGTLATNTNTTYDILSWSNQTNPSLGLTNDSGTYKVIASNTCTSTPYPSSNEIFKGVTCSNPYDLQGTNVGTTQFDGSFSNAYPLPLNGYIIRLYQGISPSGTLIGTFNSATSTITFTGLTAGTDYYYTAQSDCGGGDLSIIATSGKITTQTSCIPITAVSIVDTLVNSGTETLLSADITPVVYSSPISYQWKKDGVNYATTSTIVLDNSNNANNGTYTLVITDACTNVITSSNSYVQNIGGGGTCPTPTVATSLSPLTATQGTAYSGTLKVKDATSVTINGLPTGLTATPTPNGLDMDVVISGTPSVSGTFAITVDATNACSGMTASSATGLAFGSLVVSPSGGGNTTITVDYHGTDGCDGNGDGVYEYEFTVTNTGSNPFTGGTWVANAPSGATATPSSGTIPTVSVGATSTPIVVTVGTYTNGDPTTPNEVVVSGNIASSVSDTAVYGC